MSIATLESISTGQSYKDSSIVICLEFDSIVKIYYCRTFTRLVTVHYFALILTGPKSCGKQILVSLVPAQTGYFQIFGAIERKVPQRKESAFRFPEFVRRVFPESKI